MVTPDARRQAVAHACAAHGVIQRRACKALGADRTRVRYRSVRPDDVKVRDAMRAVAGEQFEPTPLGAGPSIPRQVCRNNPTGNRGRLRPQINTRPLSEIGGKKGLRSTSLSAPSFR